MRASPVFVGLILAVLTPCLAPPSVARVDDGSGDEALAETLEPVRADLDALRIDDALAKIERLLSDPSLSERGRTAALVLRAEAHVARGDLDATEEDYRAILGRDPSYVPDAALTSKKALARFDKVRALMVGAIRLELDPADAALVVDGRPVGTAPGGVLPVLAGSRSIRAERKGFDPAEGRVEVSAGGEVPLRIRLVPNARDVLIRTEPDGVTVRVDGAPMGETARPGGRADAPAELLLEALPLGEHVFELSKECHRSARLTDLLTVDLMDRSPRSYRTETLEPARARLSLRGGPAGGEVRVDGRAVGRLPLPPLDLCAGPRTIEVWSGGRPISWSGVEVPDRGEIEVPVEPRPNAVLVGAAGWPPELGPFVSAFTQRAVLAAPEGADLTTTAGWKSVVLPPETDLAVARVSPLPEGGEGWFLYSPVLDTVERMETPAPAAPRPAWERTVVGWKLADSRVGGPALVVDVALGGPAASAGVAVGDRVTSVAGTAVSSAREAVLAVASAAPAVPFEIRLSSAAGAARAVSCTGRSSSLLLEPGDLRAPTAVVAAWASLDAAAAPERSTGPLANLALLLSRAGRHSAAAEILRRISWPDRRGVGAGTAAYCLARELELLRSEQEARAAFLRAKESAATSPDDDGLPVAPAAADHLADLGVAGE